MLVDPSVEELLPKAECRYSLCMLVAKRARQLVDGALPMVDDPTPSYVTLACKEVACDKVVGVEGIYTPYVPLRPEVEEARRLEKEAAENQARMDAEQALENAAADGENASSEENPEEVSDEEGEIVDEISEEQADEDSEEADDAGEED